MRNRWLSSPRWVVRLVTGTLFGGWMAGAGLVVHDDGLWAALIAGALSGAVFGLVFGTWLHRQNAQAMADTGGRMLDRTVRRATFRGPVPADDVDRMAALALVQMQADQLQAQRWWALPFYAVMIALATWQALNRSPWWWAAVALWIAAVVGTVWSRRRLARRRILLSRPG